MSESSEVARIEFGEDTIWSVWRDDRSWVFFKPVCESIGVLVHAQIEKLKGRSWARTQQERVRLPGTRAHQTYTIIDRQTFLMWLATLNENEVSPAARPKVIAYQAEVADVIDRYWSGQRDIPQTVGEIILQSAKQLVELERQGKIMLGRIVEVATTVEAQGAVLGETVSRVNHHDAKIQHLEEVAAPKVEAWDSVSTNGAWLHATSTVHELRLPGIKSAVTLNRRLNGVFIHKMLCTGASEHPACGEEHWEPYADLWDMVRLEQDKSPHAGKARRAGLRFPTPHYSPEGRQAIRKFVVNGVFPTPEAKRRYNTRSNAA